MEEEEWILLALVPKLIGAPDAEQRLERAWMERTIRARGLSSRGIVEIPAYEPGDRVRVDCRHSRLSSGPPNRWRTAYENVEVRKADVERLAREARGSHAPAASPPKQAPQSLTHQANSPAGEAEREKSLTLAQSLALELNRLFPAGRPAMRRPELLKHMRQEAGENLGVFELTTLDRAMRELGWPTRRPKRAKLRQPSR
jgi:hypothetical protein